MKADLKRLTRKQFLTELATFGADQRALIAAQVSGFRVDAAATAERRARARWDYQFFCETYFPHFVNGEVPPSLFQAHAYRLVPAMMLRPGVKVPGVAPRGEGKSTLLVQLHVLWRLVNGYTRYSGLVMDAKEQGEMMLEAVKAELEANPRLAQDFPECVGRGRLWNSAKIITANQVMVEVFGAGKRIRGRRFGAYRPDFMAIDDLENDELVRSKEQRDKRERWLRRVVANLGPPDGSMSQLYVGTLLHPDAVLARTLKNPLWKDYALIFPSIHRWPDRMDLWDQWEEQLLNDGQAAADAFYARHRVDMEAGAVVSWPAMRPLRVLMKLRAEDHDAFETEHQHDPASGDDRPFNGRIQFWVMPARDWIYFGSHDPSMGKHARRGDPAATLVGGYDRVKGVLDVVEAIIARRAPDRQIEDIIKLQQEYPRLLLWGIESVAFQEFFRTELVKRSAARHLQVPARGISSSTDKDLRIESLQPHVANGLIRLHRNHRTLIQQLQHWPEADHDDGPDALEMLWQMARRGMVSVGGGVRVGQRKSAVNMGGY